MNERRVLESWKTIASYLGRTEKTCRKWERELGLPIHRLDDSAKAHVFAYADELDKWKEEKLQAEKVRKAGRLSRLFGLSKLSRQAKLLLLSVTSLLTLIIAGLLVRQFTLRGSSPGSHAVKGVAILPFDYLSPDKEHEYLCDGMVDALISALGGIEGLRVPGRASGLYFKGKNTPLQEIGKKLNVEYVLKASVQVEGEKLRVIPQLLKVSDGYLVWSEKYDRGREDIFAVEDDIAKGVAKALEIRVLGPPGALIVKPGTQSLEAYNLYLKGTHFLRRGRQFFNQAIESYEEALEKDPNYADAYAGIAACYITLVSLGFLRPGEYSLKAKEAALKALEIDNGNPMALGVLSQIKMTYDWDFPGAENDIKKAIENNPADAGLHAAYAWILSAVGRHEEALAQAKIAIGLDPLDQNLIGCPAMLYYFAGKYDLALEGLKEQLELDSHNVGTYINMIAVYLAMGRNEEAKAANDRKRELIGVSNKPDDYDNWSGMIYAKMGNQAAARRILANFKSRMPKAYVPLNMIAEFHLALGDKDEAFVWLERAYQERDNKLFQIKVNPAFASLRDDPRFKDILRRIGLEK